MFSYNYFSLIVVSLSYKFLLIVLSLLFSLICVLVVPPIFILRYIVIICAKLFRPDLVGIVSGLDLIFGKTFHNWHTNPNEIIITGTVQEESEDFLEKATQFFETVLEDPNYQRLRQYIVSFMGYAFWKEDSHFHIKQHVKYYDGYNEFSPPVDEKWISELKKSKLKAPFGKNKSPWECIIIRNYKYDLKSSSNIAKHSYLLLRVHHALCDGISIAELSYKMCERPNPTQKPKIRVPTRNSCFETLNKLLMLIKAPYDIVRTTIEVNDRDKTPWCTKPDRFTGITNYAKSKPIPLERLKEIRHKFNVSLVSVILDCITGILRNVMIAKGMKIPEVVHCHMPLPLPNHPKGKLCNHMTFVFFPLPIGTSDSVERLRRIESQYQSLKSSSVPVSTILFLRLLASFPYMVAQNTESFITLMATIFQSNSDYQDMFGSPFEEKCVILSVPQPALHSGLCITCLTYNGLVTFELSVDSSIIETDTKIQTLFEELPK